ncbi:mannose 6-phosphate receptor domain-containing protein [Neoconidiobolus thromboides FSU 785]|nr:mannose 6-phosphate receptor domain-containing protein [Neoconidiobolus thromboides FSU 785]
MKLINYILLLIFTILYINCKDSDECQIKDKDGKVVYDLTKLIKKKDDYTLKVEADPDHEEKEMSFKLNICNNINYAKSGLMEPDTVGAILLPEKDGKSVSLGKVDKKLYKKGGHVILEYKNGDNCEDIDVNRINSKLIFTCDTNAKDEPVVEFLGDYLKCQYQFEIKSIHACPLDKDGQKTPGNSNNSSTGGGASIIWTIITVIVTVYLLGGILYNRFVMKKQGLQQIPNYEFWYNIYDFVKDMSIIILVKIIDTFKNLFNRNRNSNGYSHLNQTGGGPMLVDDDDEV